MRVAIVAESFLPTVNGVTTSVCRVATCLRDQGHQAVIIAPGPTTDNFEGFEVHGLPSVSVRKFPAGVPTPALRRVVAEFAPDVIHAASPFLLGARALQLADRESIPAVAIYQTDMPSYVAQHSPRAIGNGATNAVWRWIRHMHSHADLTLAPSKPTLQQLRERGIPRTELWGRGVDARQFSTSWRTDQAAQDLKRALAPSGEILIGYVGRLAPEKELWRLREVAQLPGTRLVLVGEGPARARIGGQLAEAVATTPGRPNRPPVFLGRLDGDELARAYAALDIFVHTGTRETFGQTIQEASASGLPVVAPARGGPLDLIEPGENGLLFDPDRPGVLRDHVDALVGDADLRQRLGQQAETAMRGRSWSALTEQLVEHYRRAQLRRSVLVA